MLYEKKMLILSGDGKGVVLIEKGGHGVTFALRTFDMLGRGPFKAGIITRTSVHVRDLPQTANPMATFTVDVGDISELHFAVFDHKLRLYGTNAKRMWEANVMQLLNKHDMRDHASLVPSAPPRAELPPISQKPRVMPMPDGSGIPQSRLSLYGDEALSESDFYTSLDFSSRMPRVDSFLDEPRVFDEIAPRLVAKNGEDTLSEYKQAETEPPEEQTSDEVQEKSVEEIIVKSEQAEERGGESILSDNQEIKTESNEQAKSEARADEVIAKSEGAEVVLESNSIESAFAETTATNNSTAAGNTYSAGEKTEVEVGNAEEENVRVAVPVKADDPVPQAEAASAGALFDSEREMPWEVTANWLKNRTDINLFVKRDTVKKIAPSDRVRYLRSSRFFERAHADIDRLFANGKKDEKLSALLPDIQWIRVEFDGHCISVGRGENTFLCYAVAGKYEKVSPIGEEAQWLPSDSTAPMGDGYWLIFQSLDDGSIISN